MEGVRGSSNEREGIFSYQLGLEQHGLPKEIFALERRPSYLSLVHLALRSEMAAGRLATHKVKHRGEVSGSGKKP